MNHADASFLLVFPGRRRGRAASRAAPVEAPRRLAEGFTLIELLVVISIIALLVAILIPSLRGARRSAQGVVCQSNLRQIGVASLLYAQEHDDRVWPVNAQDVDAWPRDGAAWARLVVDGRLQPGFLYWYVQHVDDINECPINLRRATDRDGGDNLFGKDAALDFDYTMMMNMQGARLEKTRTIGHLAEPERYGLWSMPPTYAPSDARVVRLSGSPIFVEESTYWWNEDVSDGLWSNADQIEVRHKGGGNVAFLEGHVETVKPPMGPKYLENEPADLNVNDLYIRHGDQWIRVEYRSGQFRPYGWINSPQV